jgi:hypothetical protein
MATEHGHQEFLTLGFQPGAQEQVLGTLGGLMADGVVEIAVSPQQSEPRYNPDVVDAIIAQATGELTAIVTADTFRSVAVELGMDKPSATRTHSVVSRHFFYQGIQENDLSQGVRADLLPGLVDDLGQGRIHVDNLGDKGIKLLEHLVRRLYMPEEQPDSRS